MSSNKKTDTDWSVKEAALSATWAQLIEVAKGEVTRLDVRSETDGVAPPWKRGTLGELLACLADLREAFEQKDWRFVGSSAVRAYLAYRFLVGSAAPAPFTWPQEEPACDCEACVEARAAAAAAAGGNGNKKTTTVH